MARNPVTNRQAAFPQAAAAIPGRIASSPMSFFSIWPCFALLAALLLIIRLDRPFGAIDAAGTGPDQRFFAIDGLRGLLAFGVFGHHATVMPGYFETGIWQAPPSVFYRMIGEVGVALFFAITGF